MALDYISVDLNLDQYIADGITLLELMLGDQWWFAVWLEQHNR